MPLMLGRRPRTFLPSVPHYSALKFMPLQQQVTLPAQVNYLAGLPVSLGAMLNDTLGDCTCAAIYHARQVWTSVANPPMSTAPDAEVEKAYEEFCGYVSGDPSTDQGGVEQTVLADWVHEGAPLADGSVDHLVAFVEIDPSNHDDVMRAVYDCGIVYIGLNVPAFLMASQPPAVWNVDPNGDQTIVGGHCVVVAGYDADGVDLISWGTKYRMTWAFWDQFVDEAYALADESWIAATGKDVLGLTMEQLRQQMSAL